MNRIHAESIREKPYHERLWYHWDLTGWGKTLYNLALLGPLVVLVLLDVILPFQGWIFWAGVYLMLLFGLLSWLFAVRQQTYVDWIRHHGPKGNDLR